MNEEIRKYLEQFPIEVIELFNKLRTLIYNTISNDIEEKMWAKLPTYYVNQSFVRLIAFKDHINIESNMIIKYKDELAYYKLTPKGMLQIFINQQIPTDTLKKVFVDTLL